MHYQIVLIDTDIEGYCQPSEFQSVLNSYGDHVIGYALYQD